MSSSGTATSGASQPSTTREKGESIDLESVDGKQWVSGLDPHTRSYDALRSSHRTSL